MCNHEPKREFAVRGVISLIFQAQNREEPTPVSEGFDTDLFARMYASAREERRRNRQRLRQVRSRCRLLALQGAAGDTEQVNQALVGAADDTDIEMILDSDDSEWGSQADGEASDEEL